MKILIVKPSSLGDIVHTFPAVHMIRRAFPNAFISWLVNDNLAGFVELCPDIDETLVFHRKRLGRLRNIPELFKFLGQIREHKFDVVFDFQGLFRSAVFSRASKAALIIGFKHAREGAPLFYNQKVEIPEEVCHAIDKNNLLVQSYIKDERLKPYFPKLKEFDDYVLTADKFCDEGGLDSARPLVAIAPQSRWLTKSWSPEFFAKVADLVYAQIETDFWLLGTEAERPSGELVSKACTVAKPINWMGSTNLGTMVELLRKSSCLLTNDSGPMHISAALQTPVVALFGPTSPDLTGPYGEDNKVFMSGSQCAPCYSRECENKEKLVCHSSLDAAEVAEEIVVRIKAFRESESASRVEESVLQV